MTLAEFQDVLDARGGDMSLWPAELRQAAERLVAADPQAEACLRQARRLDDLVRHGLRTRAALPDAAAARVVGRLTRDLPRQRRFALPWPALLLEVDLAPARLRIAALSPADLDIPTVNAGWQIRTLVAHLVGGNLLYTQMLRGEDPDWGTRNSIDVTSPLEQFDDSARDLAAAINALDDRARLVRTPAGNIPAMAAVGVHATDMLVHGWDLAVATGQDRALDPDLCRAAIAIVQRFPADTWGNPVFYAERKHTTSAHPVDQLIALTGRDPSPEL